MLLGFCVLMLQIIIATSKCPGQETEVVLEYKKENDLTVEFDPNRGLDASLLLKGAPGMGLKILSGTVVVNAVSGNTFRVMEVMFEFKGRINRVVVDFISDGEVVTSKSIQREAEWTTAEIRAGQELPKKGLANIEQIRIPHPISPSGDSLTLKGLFVRACGKFEGAATAKWQPPDGSTEKEYFAREALTKKQFKFVKKTATKIRVLLQKMNGRPTKGMKKLPPYFDDIFYGVSQIKDLLRQVKRLAKDTPARRKRNFLRFDERPHNKWTFPIQYTTRGISSDEEKVLEDSFAHYEEHTCLRFKKNDALIALPCVDGKFPTEPNPGHLIFVKHKDSCFSGLGKKLCGENFIHMGKYCFKEGIDIPVHELGHTLGMNHHHSRSDRDEYIRILEENIEDGGQGQFLKVDPKDYETFGVPYDVFSNMHYRDNSFSKNPPEKNIEAKDELYQNLMGHGYGLTFYDVKMINLAYCKDTCSSSISCQHKGIQNPNKCSECICPDGYGGPRCETVGTSDPGCSPNSNSKLTVSSDKQCLKSPGYDSAGYRSGQPCNWILQAPPGKRIKLWFEDSFDVRWKHWVEIKYKDSLDAPGPRFWGTKRPDVTLQSDSETAVISFRNKMASNEKFTGFKLCYQTDGGAVTTEEQCQSILNGTCLPIMQCRWPNRPDFMCPAIPGCKNTEICCYPEYNVPTEQCQAPRTDTCTDGNGNPRIVTDRWGSPDCKTQFFCRGKNNIVETSTNYTCPGRFVCRRQKKIGTCQDPKACTQWDGTCMRRCPSQSVECPQMTKNCMQLDPTCCFDKNNHPPSDICSPTTECVKEGGVCLPILKCQWPNQRDFACPALKGCKDSEVCCFAEGFGPRDGCSLNDPNGCTDANGNHHIVEEQWVSSDCKTLFYCRRNDTVVTLSTNYKCPGSTVCRKQEKIGNCQDPKVCRKWDGTCMRSCPSQGEPSVECPKMTKQCNLDQTCCFDKNNQPPSRLCGNNEPAK